MCSSLRFRVLPFQVRKESTEYEVAELVSYQLQQRDGRWHLQFNFDHQSLERLMAQRLGRTVLISSRFDWTAEQLITAYSGQQHIEQVFCGLKDGDWLGWGPMYHWTDQKIRVHAFYCMLGISLLQYLRRQAEMAWPGSPPNSYWIS